MLKSVENAGLLRSGPRQTNTRVQGVPVDLEKVADVSFSSQDGLEKTEAIIAKQLYKNNKNFDRGSRNFELD